MWTVYYAKKDAQLDPTPFMERLIEKLGLAETPRAFKKADVKQTDIVLYFAPSTVTDAELKAWVQEDSWRVSTFVDKRQVYTSLLIAIPSEMTDGSTFALDSYTHFVVCRRSSA